MLLSRKLIGAAATLVVLIGVLFPSIALAHERRTVGNYTFAVGFLAEPAIQNQPNGLDLTITDASGAPVDGAEKTLKVGIAFGGSASKDLPLRARFGLKGKYTADVIPTKAGSYSFVFSGTLNGDPVNQAFESGPSTFSDVESPAALQFPPVTESAAQASAARPASDTAIQRATLLGGAGVAVGLIGIILGAVAIGMRGRPTDSAADSESHTSVSV